MINFIIEYKEYKRLLIKYPEMAKLIWLKKEKEYCAIILFKHEFDRLNSNSNLEIII